MSHLNLTSIITINVNGLNSPIKRYCPSRLKRKPQLYAAYKKNFTYKDANRLKTGWKKINHANNNQKKMLQ